MKRWTPAIVFLVALAVRLLVVFELNGTAIFRTPQLDSFEYYSWGMQIASGDFTWPAAPPHGPGYPFFLGLLLAIGHRSILFVHIVQALLGATTALLIALIAGRVYGDGSALLSGLLAAIYAPLVLIDVSIYAEGFFVFLLSCALFAATSIRTGPALMAFVCGTTLGVAIIVRPTAAILIPVFAWQLWRRAKRALPIFAIAVLYPVLPVLAHNWSTTRDVIAIQSGGGLNFYIGNAPDHDGTAWARPGGEWDWLRGEAWRAGVRGAAAEDRYYFQRALRELRPALFAKKAFLLLQNEEIRDSHSFYFFQQRSVLLRLAPFGIVLGLAAAGAFARRREPATWLFAAYAMAMSVTVIALVVGSRYRIPIVPALLVLAGGIAGAKVRPAIILAIFLAVLGVTLIRRHEPSHRFDEEIAMEGIALGKEGRLLAAGETFGHALASNPHLAIAWTGLGDIALRQGDLPDAERLYRKSIESDARHALAYSHLALVRAAAGDRGAAIDLLRRSLAIRADRDAMYTLAGFLFANGDSAGAQLWLREVLRMNPGDAQARIALERTRSAL